MGSLKTQPESCWHFCFHTSEIYCNLLWKKGPSPTRENQRHLGNTSKNPHISILVAVLWVVGTLGLLGKVLKAMICYLLLTVKHLAACCVPCRVFSEFCLHQSHLWMISSLLSCDLIAFLTHQNLFHVRRPLSWHLACIQITPLTALSEYVRDMTFLFVTSLRICVYRRV